MKMAIQIPAGTFGVCTSAGRVGPYVSFGIADAAIVISEDTALADAAATRLGNLAKDTDSIAGAVNQIANLPNVVGALAIIGDQIAAKGDIKLTHP